MGYTEISFDITDNEQVNRYVAELNKGRSHLQAWYLSNIAIGKLRDRWAVYSREGTMIVEYSARTDQNPEMRAQVNYMPLEPFGKVSASVEMMAEVHLWNYPQIPVYIDSYEDVQTQIDTEGFRSLSASQYTKSAAVDIADAWLNANGTNVPDAFVDEVIEVVRQIDDDAPAEVVAHIVTYGRRVNGLPVRGNLLMDHTAVLVSDRGVSIVSHYWPELRVEEAARLLPLPLLSANTAIQLAAEEIARVTKGPAPVMIDEAVDVYGTLGDASKSPQLVPAYEFRTADGLRTVVDAVTGKLLH